MATSPVVQATGPLPDYLANQVEFQITGTPPQGYIATPVRAIPGNRYFVFFDETGLGGAHNALVSVVVDAGLVVLVSFISPFRAERELARSRVDDGEFIEVHVDTPLDVAEERDPKGLYAKARAGELSNFTGIDSPYEAPESPEIRIDTTSLSPEEAAEHAGNIIGMEISGLTVEKVLAALDEIDRRVRPYLFGKSALGK